MSVVVTDGNGRACDGNLEPWASYKVVIIKNTFYVWPSDYFAMSHRDAAELFSTNDLSKVRGAGSFRTRGEPLRMVIGDSYSMSLRNTEANSGMPSDGFDRLAELLGVEIDEEW